MKITKCEIEGLLIIELNIFKDDRGFFTERYNEEKFHSLGINANFVQDNHSRSIPGVVRGLHCQYSPVQSKLVGAIKGSIWDVAVDIRPNSPTYGKYFATELSDKNGKLLWIPGGFAHGFCVLGDEEADVLYKVDALYNQASERGVLWSDPELAIDWPVKNPILADKDKKMPSFAEYKANPINW
jgi:dTDP-4-dehydrorhamnose 3,5-epimerase